MLWCVARHHRVLRFSAVKAWSSPNAGSAGSGNAQSLGPVQRFSGVTGCVSAAGQTVRRAGRNFAAAGVQTPSPHAGPGMAG